VSDDLRRAAIIALVLIAFGALAYSLPPGFWTNLALLIGAFALIPLAARLSR
jgi:hypothetical protein